MARVQGKAGKVKIGRVKIGLGIRPPTIGVKPFLVFELRHSYYQAWDSAFSSTQFTCHGWG